MGAGRHLYADGKEVEVPSMKGGAPPRRFTRHCAGLGTPSKDKDALGEGEHDERGAVDEARRERGGVGPGAGEQAVEDDADGRRKVLERGRRVLEQHRG